MENEEQDRKRDAETQQIGLLMTGVLKMCMDSGLSPYDSIFAIGMATQAIMRFSIGPENEPTMEQSEVAMKIFTRGFSQTIELQKGGGDGDGESFRLDAIKRVKTH